MHRNNEQSLTETFNTMLRRLEVVSTTYTNNKEHSPNSDEAVALLTELRDLLRNFRVVLSKADVETSGGVGKLCHRLFTQAATFDNIRLLLASFFFDASKDLFFWEKTLLLAQNLGEGRTEADTYDLLLRLEYLAFMNRSAFTNASYVYQARRPLKRWYRQLYERLPTPVLAMPASAKKRVAIVLRLWREPRMYTPALEALDYAYVLSQKFGYEVRLFDANLLHGGMPLPVWPPGQFGPLPIADREIIPYKNTTFPLLHRRGVALDAEADALFWPQLEKFNPSFAIALGDCNLYADMLAEKIPTVTLHYTSDVPIQINTIAGIQNGLPTCEEFCEAILEASGKRVALLPAATDVSCNPDYNRAQFGLPQNAFVFVIVGNRLRSEISSEFMATLNEIRAACPNAWFVFVGFYDQAEEQIAPFPSLREQASYIPNIQNVRAFMDIADTMLNPDRAGGGHAATQSMAAGRPVVTLAFGDVALLVGADHVCRDWGEYTARAVQLAGDHTFYEQMVKASKKRFLELKDRSVNLCAILEAISIDH